MTDLSIIVQIKMYSGNSISDTSVDELSTEVAQTNSPPKIAQDKSYSVISTKSGNSE
jgi:hypothetical protein